MSVYCMARVFNKSKATGVDRFVLLSIADNAWDNGTNAWPSIARICHKTGLGRRTVQRSINNLIAIGELARHERPGHSSMFEVLITDDWPDNVFIEPKSEVAEKAPKKAAKTKTTDVEVFKEKKPTKEDPVWTAMLDVCGINPATINAQERSKFNGCRKRLKESNATADDVYIRAQVYRRKFENAALTPTALVSHWSSLDPEFVITQAPQVPKGWDAIAEARQRRGA